MNIVATEENRFVFNLERGEELFATLLSWLNREGIAGATLTGLGAADQLDLAYFNLTSKTYERHVVNEEVEILSLVGNVGVVNRSTMLHIHGVFGRRDLSTFGGHLFQLRVSGACEVHLTTFSSTFNRIKDHATGLSPLCGTLSSSTG